MNSTPPSSKKRFLRVGMLLSLGAVVAAVAYAKTRPPELQVERVRRGVLIRTIVTSGEVEAPRRTQLGTEVGGRVQEVLVEEGAHVEADALLAQLDASNIRAQEDEAREAVREATAQLARLRRTGVRVALATEASARAEAEQAATAFARTEGLVAVGALSDAELESARRSRDATAARLRVAEADAESASAGGTQVRVAVAALRRTQAALRSVHRRLEDLEVKAPAAGTIIRRLAEPGRVVQPGQAIFEFVADGAPRLEVHPDESHLAFIRVGQPALASVESHPEDSFSATVSRIAPAVDTARGTIEVELSIDGDAPEYLIPGMTTSVEVELARAEDVLIAPSSAVHERDGADGVWVVQSGVLRWTLVEVGLRAGALVELRGELADDATVVVPGPLGDDDPSVLVDGARVRAVDGG